jgi:hypothetical protein
MSMSMMMMMMMNNQSGKRQPVPGVPERFPIEIFSHAKTTRFCLAPKKGPGLRQNTTRSRPNGHLSLLIHAKGKLPVSPATGQGLNGCYFYLHRNKYCISPETLVELFN